MQHDREPHRATALLHRLRPLCLRKLRLGAGVSNPHFQRETVARLVTHCERIIQKGSLAQNDEMNLRVLVNLTCNAFDMAPVQDAEFEADLAVIKSVMERA